MHALAVIEPGQARQFGALVEQTLCVIGKPLAIGFPVGNLTRHAHDLFLFIKQTQAQALLCVLHVTANHLLLAHDFFVSQVPKRGGNGSHEQHHGGQWRHESKAVLTIGGWLTPPSAPMGEQGFER